MAESLLLNAGRSRRRISLTPLIDVVFILLMFFMLTASFNHWRALPLLAPVAGAPQPGSPPQQLVLDDRGQLHSAGGAIGICEQLPPGTFDADLLVAPTAGVSLQRLVACLEQLRRGGLAVSLLPVAPTPKVRP